MSAERDIAKPPFELVSDPSRAEWLEERLKNASMLQPGAPFLGWLIPDGYEALVRVFHPLMRQWIVGMSWSEFDSLVAARDLSAVPGIMNESVSWAVAAEALGAPLQPDTSVSKILDLGGRGSVDADGWRYSTGGLTGRLPIGLLCAIASVLSNHTETPTNGVAALWEGYGWQPDSQALAPILYLPQRSYFCFEAGINEFVSPGWGERKPWGPIFGAPEPTQVPNLLWPDDSSWLIVSEIDYLSTLVACSQECADELMEHPHIEAALIDRDTRVD